MNVPLCKNEHKLVIAINFSSTFWDLENYSYFVKYRKHR